MPGAISKDDIWFERTTRRGVWLFGIQNSQKKREAAQGMRQEGTQRRLYI
jgi:hypothetical protein